MALPFGFHAIRESEGKPCREGLELFTPPSVCIIHLEKASRGITSAQGH